MLVMEQTQSASWGITLSSTLPQQLLLNILCYNYRSMVYAENEAANDQYPAGYLNTTSAINAIDFKTNSGTFRWNYCIVRNK